MSEDIATEKSNLAMTPIKALMIVISVVVVIGVFLVLCYSVGITEFWPGFLFILYWGMFEAVDSKKLPHVIVGGFVGLLTGYLSHALVEMIGPSGGFVFIAYVAVIIFCQLMSWLKIAVNGMTMICLTVSTIPALTQHSAFIDQLTGFLIGIILFGGLISFGKFIKLELEEKKGK